MLNIFGTDGIRGCVGTGMFTQEQLIILGKAIGKWAQQRYGKHPRMLMVHDTRISCSFVKATLKSGLLQYPLHLMDALVLPTPATAHIMQHLQTFDCALIISASHNPYADNGIKLIDAFSGKLTPTDELSISQHINQNFNASDTHYGTDEVFLGAEELYCSLVQKLFPANYLAGKKIVLDTAHGATYRVAPTIFTTLGASVITINNTPTGININEACGAVHTGALQKAVLALGADAGFAFDGDGDRVIAVNKDGVIKNGDDLLAILLHHPRYAKTTTVVGTVMTNEGFASLLKAQNKELIRTQVGDKYIAEQLVSRSLLLGGEASGHIILSDIISSGDGILVALSVLEAMLISDNWSMDTFSAYPQIILNVPITVRKNLKEEPYASLITSAEKSLKNGRILVRYSGTEPVLRIMVETDNYAKAQELAQHLAQKLL